MAANPTPQFEGWLGHDPTSADGRMTWGPYTPKKWEETDIDVKITHCSVCGSDLSTLRSSWVCHILSPLLFFCSTADLHSIGTS
jgi:hypothetical protein